MPSSHIHELCLAGFHVLASSTGVQAEICDKGDDLQPYGQIIGAAIFIAPFILIALRRPWSDGIGGLLAFIALLLISVGLLAAFEIPDLADPVTAAMKREGCLWEPGRIEKSLMLSLVPLYSGIYWIAFRRLLFPTCT